jgi:hypothetical protein
LRGHRRRLSASPAGCRAAWRSRRC